MYIERAITLHNEGWYKHIEEGPAEDGVEEKPNISLSNYVALRENKQTLTDGKRKRAFIWAIVHKLEKRKR